MVRDRAAPAIGIDLGTTFSCVGVWQNGRVETITNSAGNRITPSYVAFTAQQRLVGDAAKLQVSKNEKNTIYDAKRLIGRKFSDAVVQEDMKTWPFKLVKGPFDKPIINVTYQGKEKMLAAEDVSSQILGEMKRIAEEYLDGQVSKAVITVPAYFNDAQRQATKDAAKIAGLEVLRIINEPTAAALAYGLQKSSGSAHHVLIFDVGGGTCDVSVLRIEGEDFKVLATDGETHLGGQDFDNSLVWDLAEEFRSTTGHDVAAFPKALSKLRRAAEATKRTLSTAHTVDIEVDTLHNGEDFYTTITRTRLEDVCSDLFEKCIAPVRCCLKEAGLPGSQIAEVVLVGGSTRIPKLQELLQEVFPGKCLYKGVNVDEAVAQGAAIQAAAMTQQGSNPVVQLHDVASLSMGLNTDPGLLSVLIPRNTPIPHTANSVFFTARDFQTGAEFAVYEGERPLSKDNNLLDKFSLSGLPPMLRGKCKFDVTMHIDADGILSVSASHQGSDNSKKITVQSSNGRISGEEMASMIMDAEIYRKQDEAAKKRVEARKHLEDYTYILRDALKDGGKLPSMLKEPEKTDLIHAVQQMLIWLEQHDLEQLEEYAARHKTLQKKLNQALPDDLSGYKSGTGLYHENLGELLRAMAVL